MSDHRTLILNSLQVEQKINRMTYQVYEQNFEEKELVLAGIGNRGMQLAEMVGAKLTAIAHFPVSLLHINLNKNNPLDEEIKVTPVDINLQDKAVIVVDDVLYTGKTLTYSLLPFLQKRVRKLQVLVLVNRAHTSFPVSPDFTGISLATTLQEHIDVELASGEMGVYLS
ncbi:MAG: phosphoribosyltransferase family protein [Bacteroidia bacterium]